MPRDRTTHRGYTAPDLLVAAGIVAVTAAMALPNLTQLVQADRLSAAGREIVSQLRFAQSAAVKTGQFHRLATDPSQPDSYRIEMSADNATWPSPSDTAAGTAGAMPRVVTDWIDLAAQYPGITITAPNTIPFDFRGAIANAGGSMTIQLAGATGSMTITVSHAGGVSLQ
jgi:Tfp pilus assembly protein FimT